MFYILSIREKKNRYCHHFLMNPFIRSDDTIIVNWSLGGSEMIPQTVWIDRYLFILDQNVCRSFQYQEK